MPFQAFELTRVLLIDAVQEHEFKPMKGGAPTPEMLKTVDVPNGPIGVAVDASGNVLVVGYHQRNYSRIAVQPTQKPREEPGKKPIRPTWPDWLPRPLGCLGPVESSSRREDSMA